LGGGGLDAGTGINVDAAGDAYVNVFTGSNERPKAPGRPPGGNPFGSFPVTAGAFDPTYSGSPMSPAPSEAAAVKLDPTGTKLLYSTYIGGGPVAVVNPGDFAGTQPFGNVVDSSGNVYITGQTNADESTFPSGHGFGSIPGFDHVLNGGGPRPSTSSTPTDSFVVKLNAAGSNVDYATYLGGSGSEQSIGIDVNGAGSAYISGTTSSSDGTFPATNGPGSTYNGGPNDAFVAKLNPFGTGLDYAGFIGGSGDDQAIGMKVDGDGNAYVAGTTNSDQATFPVKAGPSLTKAGGLGSADTDAFVAKVAEVSLTPPGPVSPGPSIPGLTPPGPGPGLMVVAPGVTGYRLTNDPFVVGAGRTQTSGSAAKARKHKKGTPFQYTLSKAATVRIVIAQRASGRRRGKRCVVPTGKLRHARRCTRIITTGTLTRISQQGANKVAFSGRIGSRALRPGRYQATLIATDATRHASRPKTITFTIVKR